VTGATVAIGASDKPWNSATTLYIARKLHAVAQGRPLAVLDVGCGDGRTIRLLEGSGHALHGCDFPNHAETLRRNLLPIFGDAFPTRIRFVEDERHIPFESGQFDAIYANQVFEHVRFLDQLLAECARVLKPEGELISLFPLATYPLEGHVRVPFAHWLPPGGLRRGYLRVCLGLGVARRLPGYAGADAAREWDERLREYTFYRFMNEIECLLTYYFDEWHFDTDGYVMAKVDLLRAGRSAGGRALGAALHMLQGRPLSWLVTHGLNTVVCARKPKPADARRGVVLWRH
jgi:SAM-dependent methyltransferase